MTIPRTDWIMIALIFIMGLFAAAQFIKISLLLDPLAAHYGTSVALISLLVSLVGLIGITFGLVAGDVVAAFGARRVMLAALILGAGSSALQMSLPELWLMVPLRIIEGFSHLALVVAAPAMMARVATDNDRPVAMAIWATFFGVSFSLASVLVPWLLSWGDMAAVFGFHACG
ncbi:MAG: MFS transporter, partial [Planktomarina sp.]